MNVDRTPLEGLLVITPKVLGDERGFFLETFHAGRYAEHGVTGPFVQDNWSRSARGILRGLHFQHPNDQGKLVWVVSGSVFDVAVDVRRGSPTFGRWFGVELSASNKKQLWLPPGFAHGFCALEDAHFTYKCTAVYSPQSELGVRWNDPAIGIDWPVKDPTLSAKDQSAPLLADVARLPLWHG